MTIHYVSYFERPWRNERNVAEALQWHGYSVECYQITDPRDRPGQNGAPAIEQGDIIFTSAPAQFGLDDMKRWHDQGAVLVCWYFDWLWGLGNREELYLPRLKMMDVIFSTDGSDNAEYEKRGIKLTADVACATTQVKALNEQMHDVADMVGELWRAKP